MAPPHAPGTQEIGPSQALTPVKETNMVLNNSDDKEDTQDNEVDEDQLLSFNDVMEAADDVVDAFESSMHSGVSKTCPQDMHAMSPPHRNIEVLQLSLRRLERFFTLCSLTLGLMPSIS